MIRTFLLLALMMTEACRAEKPVDEQILVAEQDSNQEVLATDLIDERGMTLETRFRLPEGYQRIPADPESFGNYLRKLPLKAYGAEVRLYDGRVKPDRNVYHAVVDLPIGRKDLHQCADAIMRLRAEYLYEQQQYDRIHFNYTNGFRVDYARWMQGYRVLVQGNRTSWVKRSEPSNTRTDLWNYLESIFTYAGTLSLARELHSVDVHQMAIGDVFIQGGSPGHAVIVVDMAEHVQTGERIFMLAQSYMPAQEIQILRSTDSEAISPWIPIGERTNLETPEWDFQWTDLKRFE